MFGFFWDDEEEESKDYEDWGPEDWEEYFSMAEGRSEEEGGEDEPDLEDEFPEEDLS
ncbi:MAG: hypothetical protein WHS88_08610 [Anaerohalosphaeraceae bacterium]